MVGIGSGIPSDYKDIRLGDVAVSEPTGLSGGVLQYDYGVAVEGGTIIPKGHLNRPPALLLNALRTLQAIHPKILGVRILNTVKKVQGTDDRFCYPGTGLDRLFNAEYRHAENVKQGPQVREKCGECLRCAECDHLQEIKRKKRNHEYPDIHYGVIASGNQVIRDGVTRDRIASANNAICSEIEAAGLMNDFLCTVVRGISDYADSHKNKDWQGYAALVAAAYAKELLCQIAPGMSPRSIGSLQRQKPREVVFRIPLSQSIRKNDATRGRETVLSMMDDTFLVPRTNNDIRLLDLVGPGGIGKTQIAIEYAITRQNNYSAIFWISAMDENSIHGSFVDIMKQIVAETATAAITWPEYSEKIQAAFLRWLRLPGNNKWLLIYDNVDDLEGFRLQDFFPKSCVGNIIITSRRPKFERYGKQIEIEVLNEKDAVDLLVRHANIEESTRDNRTALNTLVELLGYMPLAINLAGAFISRTKISVEEYTSHYQNNFINAQSTKPRFGWDYRSDTVAATWEISFAAIERQDKGAASLLLTCSYLNPKELAQDLWYSESLSNSREIEVRRRVSLLASYSLVRMMDFGFFSVHPVIHSWARKRLARDEKFQIIRETFGIAVKAVKRENVLRESVSWNAMEERRIFAHTENLRQNLQHLISEFLLHEELHHEADLIGLGDIIHDLGTFADNRGNHNEAMYWYEQALALKQKFVGNESLSTIITLHHMAGVFFNRGQYDVALESYERVLSVYEKTVGSDNALTLNVTQHIAAVYENQGRYIEALDQYNLVLAKFETTFGAIGLPTIKVVNNMAIVFDSIGRYDEAIELYQRVLVSYEKVLGTKNLNTLDASHNIGVTLYKMGKSDQALRHFNRALAGYEAAFGDDNQSTLDIINCLATVFQGKGDYDLALQYYDRALAGYIRLFEEDHPYAYKTLGNMATIFDSLGNYEEAIGHYERAVEGYKKHLGNYDPSTLDIIHGMAGTFYKQGEYNNALKLYEEAHYVGIMAIAKKQFS
ncbi:Nephrocystin-3 [Dactylellina cionopaga]|nr:Nephrocystin-3 [Dactylellina cionopaga]